MREKETPNRKSQLLVVDDEPFISDSMKELFETELGDIFEVFNCYHPKKALQIFEYRLPNLVVSDVKMPKMTGIEMAEKMRKIKPDVHVLFLSGYDEFEYARAALKMDVEEYILKPINEEQLDRALKQAAKHLDEMDKRNAVNLEAGLGWLQFLKGEGKEKEKKSFCEMLPPIEEQKILYPAIMKLDLDSLEEAEGISNILVKLQKKYRQVKPVYLSADVLLCLFYVEVEWTEEAVKAFFEEMQDVLESELGVMSFISVGDGLNSYEALPHAYGRMMGMLRYRLLTGYGRCMSEVDIRKKSTEDITMDASWLRKKILEKDQDGALQYVEELFMNCMEANTSLDGLYQIALKTILLLQDIKSEYHLNEAQSLKGISELMDRIYQAEDIFGIRTILMLEITAVITLLHTEDSQYTPVIREILSNIQKNYKEDFSLKVLSYKYHMNTSYLGQIFQKEVGCSFNQYLSNIKNEKAKELILNTNMKINDIAREVGYPDTSYFYRKFKQCYGVSPASLRNMKKY